MGEYESGPMLSTLMQKSRQNNSLGEIITLELETRGHLVLKISVHQLLHSVVGVVIYTLVVSWILSTIQQKPVSVGQSNIISLAEF